MFFTGSTSTGKTTQLEYFIKCFPEYKKVTFRRRDLAKDGIIKINKEASTWDEIVLSGDVMLSLLSTSTPCISDRSWVDKCAYAQCLNLPEEVLNAFHIINVDAFLGVGQLDRYFYFPPVLEIANDGVRPTDFDYQQEHDYWVQFYLDLFSIPYHTIESYTVMDRHFEIMKVLEK